VDGRDLGRSPTPDLRSKLIATAGSPARRNRAINSLLMEFRSIFGATLFAAAAIENAVIRPNEMMILRERRDAGGKKWIPTPSISEIWLSMGKRSLSRVNIAAAKIGEARPRDRSTRPH
jgi:hypothetical protein